jgi:hypothetical protein
MKRTIQEYARLATQEFLEGTRFKTPVQAVEAGTRPIEQWCDCINAHRQEASNQKDSNQFEWQDNSNPVARPANT